MSFKTDIQATRSDAAAGASAIIAQPTTTFTLANSSFGTNTARKITANF